MSEAHSRNASAEERNPWLILIVLCGAIFMLLLDTTIVNVAQQKIREGLHADLAQIQWILDSYILAYAVLISDADGNLVYFNEPAERLLGRTYAETGELSSSRWAPMLKTEELDGTPLPLERLPGGVALIERRPAHRDLAITGLDGVRREISATAFPLLSSATELVGMMAIFWRREEGASV